MWRKTEKWSSKGIRRKGLEEGKWVDGGEKKDYKDQEGQEYLARRERQKSIHGDGKMQNKRKR